MGLGSEGRLVGVCEREERVVRRGFGGRVAMGEEDEGQDAG